MTRGAPLAEPMSIGALASMLGGDVDEAAREVVVDRVVRPADARSGRDLSVLTSSRRLGDLAGAGVVLCSTELGPRVPAGRRWAHAHVMWAVAKLIGDADRRAPRPGAAHVEDGAEVARTAVLGVGAVVMAGARIAGECAIGPGAVIHGGVTVGPRTTIGPNAVIGRPGFGWATGPDGDVVRVPQLGGVHVGAGVEIGALCTVDSGTLGPTIIEDGAKLDAHVHVGHNARIGAGTLVAAQAGFAGSAEVGRGVLVGGQAGVADHAQIGDGARVSAKAGVIGDIAPGSVVAGFPAVSRIRWLRAWARLLRTRNKSE